MSQQNNIQYGDLQEKDDVVIYEIPKVETNIVEEEQLEELKRDNRSFFDCLEYTVDDSLVRIHYKRDTSYRNISKFYNADKALKLKIVSNLLSVETLIGTQYTTIIHPDNIYVNDDAEVKFAHRGIRSVLPPIEMDVIQLIHEIKGTIIYLFTSHKFGETEHVEDSDPMIKSIQSAASIEQIKQIIQSHPTSIDTKPKLSPKSKQPVQEQTKTEEVKKPAQPKQPKQPKQSKPTKPPKEKKQKAPKPPKDKKQDKPKKGMSLLSGLLIGVLIGGLALYAIKVMPLTKETAATEEESEKQQEVLTEENEALQAELDHNEAVNNAYRSAVSGNAEEAISLFEETDKLDENAKKTLIEQYIALGTVESLTKAAEMSEDYQEKAVIALVELNSDEANKAILNIESDNPRIQVEQAWINDEYEDVIKHFESISDNKRAKYLAAMSYIELEDTKEAMKLGKDLNNKSVQIASLEKDIELVKADKKMKKDKKKDETKKLEKEIKKLKK